MRRSQTATTSTKNNPATRIASSGVILATSYSRAAYRRTTIGAAAFHCRVRNGNGWGHCALITRHSQRIPLRMSGDV